MKKTVKRQFSSFSNLEQLELSYYKNLYVHLIFYVISKDSGKLKKKQTKKNARIQETGTSCFIYLEAKLETEM